jgi:hypothetical protein
LRLSWLGLVACWQNTGFGCEKRFPEIAPAILIRADTDFANDMTALFASLTILSLAGWVFLRHSFFAVPFVAFLSIWVEDFFPLSHFPMYSDPDNSENYFYVATQDEDGGLTPLPVNALTGVTAPKVKKMYKSWSRDFAAKLGKSDSKLTKEERAEVGRDLLAYLNEQALSRKKEFPGEASLIEVWIVYDDEKGFSETPEVVATLPAGALPVSS